jgi:hypothetical protein
MSQPVTQGAIYSHLHQPALALLIAKFKLL